MTTTHAQTVKAAMKAAVDAAMSVAEDVVAGRMQPAALEAQAVTECRNLFARVAGPGDPLWELHVDVARQVLAVGGGIPANELAEWTAVTTAAEAGSAGVTSGPSWIEQMLAEDADDEDETDEV